MTEQTSRGWIKNPRRNEDEYKQGVQNFINFVKQHSPQDIQLCVCPCKKCKNSKKISIETVEKHLIVFGMLSTYDVWFFHGERNNATVQMTRASDSVEELPIQDQMQVEEPIEGALGNLVNDAFRVHDMPQASGEVNFEEIHVQKMYHEYRSKANEKIYPSCEDGLTTLGVMVELQNLKKEFNWSGNSMTELLKLFKKCLPKENTLPDKYPTMKKMLKDLGMKVKSIHACENDCMLFWKENANIVECPHCHTPRFKDKANALGIKK